MSDGAAAGTAMEDVSSSQGEIHGFQTKVITGLQAFDSILDPVQAPPLRLYLGNQIQTRRILSSLQNQIFKTPPDFQQRLSVQEQLVCS